MKRKIVVFIFLANMMLCDKAYSQVTISPEIGISYLPFTLYGANRKNESKSVNYLFGLSAKFPVLKKWFLNTSLNYVDRGEVRWVDQGFVQNEFESYYRQNDINIDLSIIYQKNEFFGIGLGPSFIKKYNSAIGATNWKTGEEVGEIDQNTINFGSHLLLQLEIQRFIISVNYARKFKTDKLDIFVLRGGKDRLNISFSMKLFGFNKKK